MKKRDILFILIQIDEAHSSAWPAGLENQPEPQKDISDRLERANKFVSEEIVPFPVFVDTWNNDFAETYLAWPDKYYLFDENLTILQMSTYGHEGERDALIDVDCVELIKNMTN